ncbi:hypothetical protein BU26DRAFT_514063 [Trematosphaeria pertusa]|uniref:SRR1-like domain-containing protein n=1 Tax=Trematosphaeria pertusa TaxID=390896 RepID=A0A6A6J4L1_9PLEO|nr:uncharacterized protein BU26DRAFT_514063 [Trematosphaeria pertusa]KAF2257371.1 hypothetical protein BU26DRAFT_514063 [Trematosphaeria pertusa]
MAFTIEGLKRIMDKGTSFTEANFKSAASAYYGYLAWFHSEAADDGDFIWEAIDVHGGPFTLTIKKEHKVFGLCRESIQAGYPHNGYPFAPQMSPYSKVPAPGAVSDREMASTAEDQSWARKWQESELFEKVRETLKEYVPKTALTNKVVGFGLGGQSEELLGQSVLAAEVGEVLNTEGRKHWGDASYPERDEKTMDVWYEDPTACESLLQYVNSKFPGIEVELRGVTTDQITDINKVLTEGEEAFVKRFALPYLDGNTFVVSIAPKQVTRQAVIEMTHPYGGPAGMLCPKIVGADLLFYPKGEVGPDPSCTLLEKYKNECYEIDLGTHWDQPLALYLKKG